MAEDAPRPVAEHPEAPNCVNCKHFSVCALRNQVGRPPYIVFFRDAVRLNEKLASICEMYYPPRDRP